MRAFILLLSSLLLPAYLVAQDSTQEEFSKQDSTQKTELSTIDQKEVVKRIVRQVDIIVAPSIVTDRPTVGLGNGIVPYRRFQVETGGSFGQDEAGSFQTNEKIFNSTQIRYGIAQNAELRLSTNWIGNDYTHLPTGLESDDNGFAPLTIGTKISLSRNKYRKWNTFTLVINAHLNKVASSVYQTPLLGHDIILVNNIALSGKSNITSNFGLIWDGTETEAKGIYTVAYSRKINNRWTAVGELYGDWLPARGLDIAFDGGATFLWKNNLQLDVIGGFGISERAQDWFIGGGLGYLIGK